MVGAGIIIIFAFISAVVSIIVAVRWYKKFVPVSWQAFAGMAFYQLMIAVFYIGIAHAGSVEKSVVRVLFAVILGTGLLIAIGVLRIKR